MANNTGGGADQAQMILSVLFKADLNDGSFRQATNRLKNLVSNLNGILERLNTVRQAAEATIRGELGSVTALGPGYERVTGAMDRQRSSIFSTTRAIAQLTGETRGYELALGRLTSDVTAKSHFETIRKGLKQVETQLTNNALASGIKPADLSKFVTEEALMKGYYEKLSTIQRNFVNRYKSYSEETVRVAERTWARVAASQKYALDPAAIEKVASRLMSLSLARTGQQTRPQEIVTTRESQEKRVAAITAEFDRLSNAIPKAKAQFAALRDELLRGDASIAAIKGQFQKLTNEIREDEARIKFLDKAYKDLIAKHPQLTFEAGVLRAALKQQGAAVDEIARKFRALSGDETKEKTRINAINNAYQSLSRQYPAIVNGAKNLRNELIMSGATASEARGAFSKLRAEHIDLMRTQARGVNSSNLFSRAMGDVIGKMKLLAGYAMAGGIVYQLFSGFREGVQAVIQFDQALANLKAITGSTAVETEMMGAKILEVSNRTRFSSKWIAEGMTLLGQAGFTAGQTMNIIDAAANLSTGTLEHMEVTVDLLSTALIAFNLNAQQSTRAADVMAVAINKSKLTVEKLRISFGYVGALAGEVGLSLEETAASLMTLADHGLRASTMGTSLRMMLSTLIAPNEKLRNLLGQNQTAINDISDSSKSWTERLSILAGALWNEEKQVMDAGKAYEVFGVRAMQAALILSRAIKSGEYTRNVTAAYNAVGASAAMASIQMEGLGLKMENLSTKAKNFAIVVGESGATGALGKLVDILRLLFDVLTMGSATFGKFVFSMTSSTVVITGLYVAYKTLIAYITAARAGVYSLGAAFGAANAAVIASPWVLGIATALAAGLYVLDKWTNGTREAIDETKKQAIEAGNAADALHTYADMIQTLSEKAKTNNTAQLELNSTITRILTEFPQYAAQLADVAKNYDQLTAAIKRFAKEQALLDIQKSAESIGLAEEEKARLNKFQNTFGWMWTSDYQHQQKIKGINLEQEQDTQRIINQLVKENMDTTLEGGMLQAQMLHNATVYLGLSKNQYLTDTRRAELAKQIANEATAQTLAAKQETIVKTIADNTELNAVEDLAAAKRELHKVELKRIDAQNKQKLGQDTSKEQLAIAKELYDAKIKEIEATFALRRAEEGGKPSEKGKNPLIRDKKINSDEEQAKNQAYEQYMSSIGMSEKKGVDASRKLADAQRDLAQATEQMNEYQMANSDNWEDTAKAYELAAGEALKLKGEIEALRAAGVDKGTDVYAMDQLTEKEKLYVKYQTAAERDQKKYVDLKLKNDAAVRQSEEALMKQQMQIAAQAKAGKFASDEDITRAKASLASYKRVTIEAKMAAVDALLNRDDIKQNADLVQVLQDRYISLGEELGNVSMKQVTFASEIKSGLEQIGKTAMDELSNAFGNIVSGSGNADDAFQKMCQSMINQLAAVIAKLMLMTALMATIGKTEGGYRFLSNMGVKDAFGLGFGAVNAAGGATGGGGFWSGLTNLFSSSPASRVNTLNGYKPRVEPPAGQGGNNYNMYISANDAKSFADMLSQEPSRKAISHSVVNSYAHNGSLRNTLRKG